MAFDAGSSGFDFHRGATAAIRCRSNAATAAKASLPSIWRRFSIRFTTKRGHGGTGLGLNIVYNIVTQQCSGVIHVASPGAGTRFHDPDTSRCR